MSRSSSRCRAARRSAATPPRGAFRRRSASATRCGRTASRRSARGTRSGASRAGSSRPPPPASSRGLLDVERDVEEHAEHRERDEQHRDVRPENVGLRKSLRSSIGRRWAAPARRTGRARRRRREGAEDARRSPAVRVRLDQPVGEREEPDRRRGEPGHVRPLPVRGVLRLVDEQVRRDDREHADGHVDEEDPAPADVLGEEPPTSGPIASASAETPAQMPIAVPRCRAGKVAVMIESVAGIISAAPTPCTTRAPISISGPVASPQASDAAVKTARPATNIAAARAGRRACRRSA